MTNYNFNNQQRLNQYQTPQNNSNLWRDNLPAKAGYYTQNEKLPAGVPRQISNIQAGQATSFQEFHGMQLYQSIEFYNIEFYFLKNKYLVYYNMSEQQFIEDTEIEAVNDNVEIPKKEKRIIPETD